MNQIVAQHEATIKHHLIVRAMIAAISVIRKFLITENNNEKIKSVRQQVSPRLNGDPDE